MNFRRDKMYLANELNYPYLFYKLEGIEKEALDDFDLRVIPDILDRVKQLAEPLRDHGPLISQMTKHSWLMDSLNFEALKRFDDFGSFEAWLLGLTKEELVGLVYHYQSRDLVEGAKVPADLRDHLNWVQALDLEDQEKWALLQYLEEPLPYIQQYFALFSQLRPSFEGAYQAMEQALLKTAQEWENRLDKDPHFLAGIFYEVDEYLSQNDLTQLDFVPSLLMTDFLLMDDFHYVGIHFLDMVDRMKNQTKTSQEDQIALFKNLGDPTRYAILMQIAKGNKSLKDMADRLGISSPSVSYHINQMVLARLVSASWRDKDNQQPVFVDRIQSLCQALVEDLKIQ